MEFCSDYVYMYETPDFEYISDEEYEAGMNVSDSDSDSPVEENESAEGAELKEQAPPPPPGLPRGGGGANLFCAKTSTTMGHFASKEMATPLPAGAVPPPPAPVRHGLFAKKKHVGHWKRSHTADRPLPPSHGNRRVRQGDTNIVTVKFDKLIAPSNMHAGDPQECTKCGGVLSRISKLERLGEEMVWICEFCENRNVLDIEEEEKPLETDVTYMLEPALSTTASGPTGLDESLVVFCVDISGSMCVTTEVPGHVELRGAPGLRRAQQMNRERADQYLPNQRRNVTYVSRLQSVQAAIDHQLGEMAKEYPNRRVALVTFSNEVTVIGDGKGDPVSIAGDKLTNKETLKSIAAEQAFPDAVKNSRQPLGQKLFDLEEGGPTALGPALLVAMTMASKVRGSKVILCTDGLANVGMGKLDNYKNDEEQEEAIKFYEAISSDAMEKGVSISVITIKGTDCKLVEIGKMADRTGGQVNIVDPLKLTQEFSTILANKIIATNVVATFILHKELFFFYEDTEESKVVKNIGNVTSDTEISFEYGVRTKPKKKASESQDKLKTVREATVEMSKDELSEKTEENTCESTESEGRNSEPPEMEQKEGAGPMSSTAMETGEFKEGAEPVLAGGSKEPMSSTGMDTGELKEGAEPVLAGRSTEEPVEAPGVTPVMPEPVEGPGISGDRPEPLGASGVEEEPSELPFQLQIVYTDTEGAKALRVITQTKPITRDRRKAERLAKMDVLARHTAMTAARMAQDGMFTMSRERALMNQRVAWRHTKEDLTSKTSYKKAFGKIKNVENYLNAQQQEERASRGRTYSDDESDEAQEAEMAGPHPCVSSDVGMTRCNASGTTKERKTKSFFSRLKKNRSATTSDYGADLVFKGKKPKSFFEDSD